MKTREPIRYILATGKRITIPAGTPVEYASNLPQGGWWAKAWAGMTEDEVSHLRNYGYWMSDDEVTNAPYVVGQRLVVLSQFPAYGEVVEFRGESINWLYTMKMDDGEIEEHNADYLREI